MDNGCLNSVNFSVMINGKLRGKIRAMKGLRQEDPLSHFPFVLCADTLSLLLKRAIEREMRRGMKMGKENLEISHL